MRRSKSYSGMLAAMALLCFWSAATAQDYSFSVPSLKMQVFVNADASVKIVYDITFNNRGRPIDVVDIGTPHEDYRLGNVTASIGGAALRDVRKSGYVDPGFEVHLDGRTIAAGSEATLHVEFTMPDMVYQDTTNPDNASLRITPTWFDRKFVTGQSDIQVAIHLPAGVKPEEALHHGKQFSAKAIFGEDKHTVVSWRWPSSRATGPHEAGVSFPKRGMTRVVTMSKFGLLVKWFRESPGVRFLAGIAFLIGFGILFFRFSGGTGISVFVVLALVLVIWFYNSPAAHLIAFIPLIVLIALNEWHLWRRQPRYVSAIAQVEGGGIKRGLTAPEAAVLLELTLGKVLTLVIFGLLKKRILRQVQAEPLTVEVDPPFKLPDDARADPKKQAKFYRRAGRDNNTVIHPYEHPFLFLLESNPGKPAAELNFSAPVKNLIERVVARMKGFDLSDTQDYYRSIVSRAMTQARSIGEIEQREEALDRDFEWLLLDDDYPTVFTHRDYHYRPSWTRGSTGGSTDTSSSPASGGKTSFGDVAASFAGWSENTMGKMATAIMPGGLDVGEAPAGVIDLSGVDRVTGDFFKAISEASEGSGGFGGGGGGCACAGCACACACAGGGR